jgi:steroid 5-alpha reductase family enzyme
MESGEKKSLIALPIILSLAFLIALAGSDGGDTISGVPLFALCVIMAFVIQWIAFIPAFKNQTEKYFDLTGGLTYISVITIGTLLNNEIDLRSVVLLSIISIWALRLAFFLFRRVRLAGEDRRFRELKTSFLRFLVTWTLQGMWVTFTLAAALAAVTSQNHKDIGFVGVLGLIIWVFGFSIEVVADLQKSKFRSINENKDQFIDTGLWAWSRHPNYFGEIVLWIGIAVIALPALSGWQYFTLISPIFVILLLTKISGVPMLETRSDEKWGGQEDYEAYKLSTPVLIPRKPKSN